MRLQSCFSRYARYMLRCCVCSVLTFFINSGMLVNKEGMQILSTAVFVLVTVIDSYNFARFFGKTRHIKFGMVYPYLLFIVTVYAGHFLIASARWKYLFLPFGILANYGFSRLMSITAVHVSVVLLSFVSVIIGRRKFYKNN